MKRFIKAWLIFWWLVGCATLRLPISAIQTSTNTSPPLVVTTPSLDTQLLTLTASRVLPVQEAFSRVEELFQTNGGCRLPCWWGITPGQTKWKDAKTALFPLARGEESAFTKDGKEVNYFRFPSSANDNIGFEQRFLIKDDVVQEIEIKPGNLSPYSEPRDILIDYGIPDVVYLGGNLEPDAGQQYFSLVFYYTKQRIFAYYGSGFSPIQNGASNLSICFSKAENFELHLWGRDYSFDQTRDSIFLEHRYSFLPLETVTDLTLEGFYKIFTDPALPPCLETPAKNWQP